MYSNTEEEFYAYQVLEHCTVQPLKSIQCLEEYISKDNHYYYRSIFDPTDMSLKMLDSSESINFTTIERKRGKTSAKGGGKRRKTNKEEFTPSSEKGICWVGAGEQRDYGTIYDAVMKDGEIFRVHDCVYLFTGTDVPFICYITQFFEDAVDKAPMLEGCWFFRKEDVKMGANLTIDPKEIFFAKDFDENPINFILQKVTVKHVSEINNLEEFKAKDHHFYYRKVYFSNTCKFYSVVEPNLEKNLQFLESLEKNPYFNAYDNVLPESMVLDKEEANDTPSNGNNNNNNNFNSDAVNYTSLNEGDEETNMCACVEYADFDLVQPFQVEVSSSVLMVIDFHAHLFSTEIIGLLGGTWDGKKKIYVQEAFPCKSIEGADSKNVEMDPISELEVKKIIQDQNLQIVGWYHSHTSFLPDPSLRDISNQMNYQLLFRDEKTGKQPFIGAIAAVYDTQLPNELSVFNWFNVMFDTKVNHPMKLYVSLKEDTTIQPHIVHKLENLVAEYQQSPKKINLKTSWLSTVEKKGSKATISKGKKMKVSVMNRMPSKMTQEEKESLIHKLLPDI